MKVLLDTDVLLDVALRRAEFYPDSAAVLSWAEQHPGEIAVAWHTLANLFYLVRPDARGFIADLLEFAEVPATGTQAMRAALGFPMRDLEDAMQVAAASEWGARYIITRNLADFRKSPIPALSPRQFLSLKD